MLSEVSKASLRVGRLSTMRLTPMVKLAMAAAATTGAGAPSLRPVRVYAPVNPISSGGWMPRPRKLKLDRKQHGEDEAQSEIGEHGPENIGQDFLAN